MIQITVKNFQDGIECKSILHSSKESFIMTSCEFVGGEIYGIISDYGCGAWGFSTCMGGRCSNDYSGEFYLNNVLVSNDELLKRSCFVTETYIDGINNEEEPLTPQKCIEKALEISGTKYSLKEIKEMFDLTGEINGNLEQGRFNRDMRYVGIEIWQISMAIGFASDKEIFCFPWIHEQYLSKLKGIYESKVFDNLKKAGKIVLIPTNHYKEVKKYCSGFVQYTNSKVVQFNKKLW